MKRSIIIAAATVTLISSPLLAQAQTSPTDPFSVSAHFIVLTKLRRFFTFDAEGKAQLTLAIENGLLLRAADQAASGDTKNAATTLQDFSAERASLSSQLEALTPNNRAVHHLLADVASDDVHQLKSLAAMTATVDQAKQAVVDTNKDIAHVIGLPALSPEDRDLTATEAVAAVAKDKSSDVDKVAAKINLKNAVEDVAEKAEAKTALKHQEDADVAEAAQLPSTDLTTLVEKLDSSEAPRHNLVVLQKLLTVVPVPAKTAIEAALDTQAVQEAGKVSKDDTEVKKIGDDSNEPAEIRAAVLDRVKAKGSDDVKKKIDPELVKVTDDILAGKTLGSSTSSGSNKSDDASPAPTSIPTNSPSSGRDSSSNTSSSHGGQATASPTSSSSHGGQATATPAATASTNSGSSESSNTSEPSSPTPSPTASTTVSTDSGGSSVSQTSVTLKVKNGALDPSNSLTVKNNSNLTLQFENDDANPAQLTLANGLTSGSVAKDAKVSLQSFVITGPVSFRVVINGVTLNGTINVQ